MSLVHELCKLPRETAWVEFNVNAHKPMEIGAYVSARVNSTALAGKPIGHMVWGISDHDDSVVRTRFNPNARKVGNEELESWLLRLADFVPMLALPRELLSYCRGRVHIPASAVASHRFSHSA